MWSQSAAFRVIVVAGCLATIYTQLTTSPATVAYARTTGAAEWQVGLLGALPTGMLFMQFLSALVANRLRYRRGLWVLLSLIQRSVFIPLAWVIWFAPGVSDQTCIWWLILTTAANQGLLHFCTPLWLSWMGDYLPKAGLSAFWGRRQLWMQWTAAAALLGTALLMSLSVTDIRPAFALILLIGSICGIADIFCFLHVVEPPVVRAPEPNLWPVVRAPFLDLRFRSFICYSCFWNFAAVLGAPFISLYLMNRIGMELFQVLLLWTASWVGGAACSGWLGRLVERYGNRPILILCTAGKMSNMLFLVVIPANPVIAFWTLLPVFMVDAALNGGILIATNGFLLKNSPAANRTMFIAAGTALAGMVGGLTSVAAGFFLSQTAGLVVHLGRYELGHFRMLFAGSLLMRLIAVPLASRIREPGSQGAVHVLQDLIGVGPVRLLDRPLRLYRAWLLPHAKPLPAPPATLTSPP